MVHSIDAKDCKLRELNLSGRYLGYVGIEPLVTMLLKKKNILQKLKVARNGFGNRGAELSRHLQGLNCLRIYWEGQNLKAFLNLLVNLFVGNACSLARDWPTWRRPCEGRPQIGWKWPKKAGTTACRASRCSASTFEPLGRWTVAQRTHVFTQREMLQLGDIACDV